MDKGSGLFSLHPRPPQQSHSLLDLLIPRRLPSYLNHALYTKHPAKLKDELTRVLSPSAIAAKALYPLLLEVLKATR
jgi:hypothetical protein